MRLTQSKELNKGPEVTGSNLVKYKNNNIFLLSFFFWFIGIFFSYRWVCAKHHYQHFFSHTITIDCVLAHVALKHLTLIIPTLFIRKKGILISYQSLTIVCPSHCPSARTCVRPSITFLVKLPPPKPLDGATSNFVPRQITCCRGYWVLFHVTLTPRSRSNVRKCIYL